MAFVGSDESEIDSEESAIDKTPKRIKLRRWARKVEWNTFLFIVGALVVIYGFFDLAPDTGNYIGGTYIYISGLSLGWKYCIYTFIIIILCVINSELEKYSIKRAQKLPHVRIDPIYSYGKSRVLDKSGTRLKDTSTDDIEKSSWFGYNPRKIMWFDTTDEFIESIIALSIDDTKSKEVQEKAIDDAMKKWDKDHPSINPAKLGSEPRGRKYYLYQVPFDHSLFHINDDIKDSKSQGCFDPLIIAPAPWSDCVGHLDDIMKTPMGYDVPVNNADRIELSERAIIDGDWWIMQLTNCDGIRKGRVADLTITKKDSIYCTINALTRKLSKMEASLIPTQERWHKEQGKTEELTKALKGEIPSEFKKIADKISEDDVDFTKENSEIEPIAQSKKLTVCIFIIFGIMMFLIGYAWSLIF